MHSGVQVRDATAVPRMKRQSLAFGVGPEDTGNEHRDVVASVVVVVDTGGVVVVVVCVQASIDAESWKPLAASEVTS
jgi:hypothetical protein